MPQTPDNISAMYNDIFKDMGYFKDEAEFRKLLADPISRKQIFKDIIEPEGYFKDEEEFVALLGLKKKEEYAFAGSREGSGIGQALEESYPGREDSGMQESPLATNGVPEKSDAYDNYQLAIKKIADEIGGGWWLGGGVALSDDELEHYVVEWETKGELPDKKEIEDYLQRGIEPEWKKQQAPDEEVDFEQVTQKHKNLNFVKRALNPDDYPHIKNEDGSVSSHLLSAEVDNNGDWIVFPMIIQKKDGKLKKFEDPWEALDYAKKTGELINFGKNKDAAIKYSENGLIDHTKEDDGPLFLTEIDQSYTQPSEERIKKPIIDLPVQPKEEKKVDEIVDNLKKDLKEKNLDEQLITPFEKMTKGGVYEQYFKEKRNEMGDKVPLHIKNAAIQKAKDEYLLEEMGLDIDLMAKRGAGYFLNESDIVTNTKVKDELFKKYTSKGFEYEDVEKAWEELIGKEKGNILRNSYKDSVKRDNPEASDEEINNIIFNNVVSTSKKLFGEDDRELAELNEKLREELKKDKPDLALVGKLEDQIKEFDKESFYDEKTGLRHKIPKDEQEAAFEEKVKVTLDKLLAEQKANPERFVDKLRDLYHNVGVEYLEYQKLYDAKNDQLKLIAPGYSKTAKAQELKKELDDIFMQMEGARAKFKAVSKLYLLNEDPAGTNKKFFEKEGFMYHAQYFGKSLTAGIIGPETASDWFGVTEKESLAHLDEVASDAGFTWTKEQQEKIKASIAEDIAEGIGGLGGIVIKFALLNKVAGAMAVPEMLAAIRTMKGGKLTATIVELAIEGEKFKAIGGTQVGGATFAGTTKLMHKLSPKKAPWILKPLIAAVNTSVSMTTAGEVSEVFETTIDALMKDKKVAEVLEEEYGDISVMTRKIIVGLGTNMAFGITPFLGARSYINDPVKLRSAERELRAKGKIGEADQIKKRLEDKFFEGIDMKEAEPGTKFDKLSKAEMSEISDMIGENKITEEDKANYDKEVGAEEKKLQEQAKEEGVKEFVEQDLELLKKDPVKYWENMILRYSNQIKENRRQKTTLYETAEADLKRADKMLGLAEDKIKEQKGEKPVEKEPDKKPSTEEIKPGEIFQEEGKVGAKGKMVKPLSVLREELAEMKQRKKEGSKYEGQDRQIEEWEKEIKTQEEMGLKEDQGRLVTEEEIVPTPEREELLADIRLTMGEKGVEEGVGRWKTFLKETFGYESLEEMPDKTLVEVKKHFKEGKSGMFSDEEKPRTIKTSTGKELKKVGQGLHTKGFWTDGEVFYKSLETREDRLDAGKDKKSTTQEYEILKDLQSVPYVVKIGRLIDTEIGKMVAVEKLEVVKKLTYEEFKEVEGMMKDLLEEHNVYYEDHPLILRGKDGKLKIGDFSTATKVTDSQKGQYKNELFPRTEEMMSETDQKRLQEERKAEAKKFEEEMWEDMEKEKKPKAESKPDITKQATELKKDTRKSVEKQDLVELPMEQAEEAFKVDGEYYIGKEGEGGLGARYEILKKMAERGELETAPIAHLRKDKNGNIILSFTDGRHRFAVLRDLGAEAIKVSMDKESQKLLEELKTQKPKAEPKEKIVVEKTVDTKHETTTFNEKGEVVSIQPKTAKGYFNAMQQIGGLGKAESVANTVLFDLRARNEAKRTGESKSDVYGRYTITKDGIVTKKTLKQLGGNGRNIKKLFQKYKIGFYVDGDYYAIVDIPEKGLYAVPVRILGNGKFAEISLQLYDVAVRYNNYRKGKPYNNNTRNINEFNKQKELAKEAYKNEFKKDKKLSNYSGGIKPRGRTTGSVSELLFQESKGFTEIIKTPNEKAIEKVVTTFIDADVSTPIHENISHPYLEARIIEAKEGNGSSKGIIKDVLDVYNEKNKTKYTEEGLKNQDTHTKVHEFFTTEFEKYVKNGMKSTSKKLQKVFDNLREWFTNIFRSVSETEIDPRLEKVFKDMFGEEYFEKVKERHKEDASEVIQRRSAEVSLEKIKEKGWIRVADPKAVSDKINKYTDAETVANVETGTVSLKGEPVSEKASSSVKDVPVKSLKTDEARFQNRTELSEDKVKDIVDNFDPNKFQPIDVYKDGDTYYVLAGHHRFEAAKRMGMKDIPVRIFKGTEKEAIDYARDSNYQNRPETDFERATRYREMLEAGENPPEVLERAREMHGSDGKYFFNLAHLDKNGKTLEALKTFEKTSDKESQNKISSIADWIGEAKRRNKGLSRRQENEMFDYLWDVYSGKKAKGKITNKNQFLLVVEALINRLKSQGKFNEDTVLNLKQIGGKTDIEATYDMQVEEAKERVNQAQKDLDEKRKDLIARGGAADLVNKALIPFEAEVRNAIRELTDLQKQKGHIQDLSKEQKGLFDNLNEVDNETVTDFSKRTEAESKELEPVIKTIEGKAESSKETTLKEVVKEVDEIIEPKGKPEGERILSKEEVSDRIKQFEETYETPNGHKIEGGLLKWYEDKFGKDSNEYKKVKAKYDLLKSGEDVVVTEITPQDLLEGKHKDSELAKIIADIGKGIRGQQVTTKGETLDEVDTKKKESKPKEKPTGPKKKISFERNTEKIKKLDKDIDDLLGDLGKPDLTMGGISKADKLVPLVAKLIQKQYYRMEDIAKFLIEKGYNEWLPYLKDAYARIKSGNTEFELDIETLNSLDNEKTIKDFDPGKIKTEKERVPGGRADTGPVGGRGKRPPIRIADQESIPQDKKEYVLEGDYEIDNHQRLGVNLALDRVLEGKGFMLADGAGVGKTRQILATADQFVKKTGKKVLIITENKRIIEDSFTNDANAMKIDLGKFEIGTYDDLRTGKIGKEEYGLTIFDESHNLKNPTSQKSMVASQLKTEAKMFTSATPMDKPIHAIYFFAEVFDRTPAQIEKDLGIEIKYYKGRDGEEFPVAVLTVSKEQYIDNLLKLRKEAVEKGAMVRREYPFFGEVDKSEHDMTIEGNILSERINEARNYRVENAESILQYARKMKGLEPLEGRALEEAIDKFRENEEKLRLKDLHKALEPQKAEMAIEKAEKYLEEGNSVVFVVESANKLNVKIGREGGKKSFHLTDIEPASKTIKDRMKEKGFEVAEIIGGDKAGSYKKAMDAFQSGKAKVLIMTAKSGGTGINLDDTQGTRPRKVIILTPDYSGSVLDQTLGRFSRRNTASPAEIEFLYLKGNRSDESRQRRISEKAEILKTIQTGGDLDVGGAKEGLSAVIGEGRRRITEGAGQPKEPKQKGVYIEERGKGIFVKGETFDMKEMLGRRGLGGKYVKGEGWMFPQSRKEEVQKAIDEFTKAKELEAKKAQEEKDSANEIINKSEESGTLPSKGDIAKLEAFEKRTKKELKPEAIKLYQSVIDLIKKYAPNAKIMQGYTGRKAIGLFYTRSKNIALKGLNDLGVAFHELTHAIDDAHGVTKKLPSEIKDRLTEVYMEFYPTAKGNASAKVKRIEGYAMLIQKYIESPSIIESKYPELVEYFIEGVGALKDMKNFLMDAEQLITDYQSLSSLEQVGTRVVDNVKKYKNSVQRKMLRIEEEIFDDIAFMNYIDKKAGTLYTPEDITSQIRFARNSSMYAEYNIDGGKEQYMAMNEKGEYYIKHDFNWRTLTKNLGKNNARFGWWLYSRRVNSWYEGIVELKEDIDILRDKLEEVRMNDEMLEPAEVKSREKEIEFQIKQAQQEMDLLIERTQNEGVSEKLAYEAYEEAREEFKDHAEMFDKLAEEDILLLSNPTVKLIKEDVMFKFLGDVGKYAPFKRAFFNQVVGEPMETENLQPITKGGMGSLKRMSGSQKPPLNPLLGAMQNHAIFTRRAHEQIVSNKIYEAYLKHPDVFGDYFNEIALTPILGKEGVTGFVESNDKTVLIAKDKSGKNKGLKILDPALIRVLHEQFNPKDIPIVLKIFIEGTRLFKTGTTGWFWKFLLNNIPLDTITRFTNTKTGILPGIHEPKELSLALALKNSPERKYFNEYLYLAGRTQTRMGWNKVAMGESSFGKVSKRRKMAALADGMSRISDFLGAPSNISEIAPRATEYIRARKQGKTQPVALSHANTVTGSFSHKGRMGSTFGQGIIKSIAYFNPNLQILHNTYKAAKTPQGRKRLGVALTMMGLISGSTLFDIFNFWDEEDKKKALMLLKSKSPEELSMHLYFPDPFNHGQLGRIRVPEIQSVTAMASNMFILQKYADADYTKREMFDLAMIWVPDQFKVWEGFAWAMSLMPQMGKTFVEAGSNKKTFPNVRPIESMSDERKVPEARYGPYTSRFAKNLARSDLGRKLNLSPKMIDHILTGSLGRTIGYVTGKPGINNIGEHFKAKMYLTSSRQAQMYFDKTSEYEKEITDAKDKIKAVTNLTRMSTQDVLDNYGRIDDPRYPKEEMIKMIKYVQDGELIQDKLKELRDVDPDTEPKKYDRLAFEIMQYFTDINKGIPLPVKKETAKKGALVRKKLERDKLTR